MKLTQSQLKQIIKEELEVILTNEEAGEFFGDNVQRQLEEDEAAAEQGGFFSSSAEEEAAEGEQAEPGAIASLAEDMEEADIDYMREDTIRFMEEFINSKEFRKLRPEQQKTFREEFIKITTIYNYAMKKGK
tara:strand:- start:399 stop:794 length:396 start_codon:yes stop_codon:yes gene_type:complete